MIDLSYYSLSRRSVLLGCIAVSICISTSTFAKSSHQKTETQQPKWEMPSDPEAKTYLSSCEADYLQVVSIFNSFSESKKISSKKESDLAVLNKLNDMDRLIDAQMSAAELYSNVHPNEAMRNAADLCTQHFIEIYSDISLSREIYDRISLINIKKLDSEDQRYVDHTLRDYRISGVNKDQETRGKIKKLNEEINKVGQSFDNNYRNGGKTVEVKSVAEMKGLPQDFINKHKPNSDGKIILTTDHPDFMPVMQYAENDALRERMHKAFWNIAYPENKTVLMELAQKRFELAQLLDFPNFAAFITVDKMIQSPKNAQEFIDKVFEAANAKAQAEYQELLARLKKIDPAATEVKDWQKLYLQELLKKEKYKVDQQEVRQYFPFARVQQGIFDLTQTMFGVTIRPWQTKVWHPSVQAFEIVDHEQVIGRFYLDLHPREGKFKHGAHFGIQSGIKGVQLPVAALVCNFPGGDDPNALLEHEDVRTFLHEFGHLLHGIFGGQHKRVAFSGMRTEHDFVEAPSQMLEEWIWDADTLASFARNGKGEVIPKKMVEALRDGRDFGRGIWIKNQLFYSALSLNIYNRNPADLDLDKLLLSLQAKYSQFSYVPDTHIYANISHLNGYSAMYYTYMWSLVIAKDMFSEFEKEGLRNPAVALRYRNAVLAPGGSKDAADLVQDFLGRPFSFDAFAKKLVKEK